MIHENSHVFFPILRAQFIIKIKRLNLFHLLSIGKHVSFCQADALLFGVLVQFFETAKFLNTEPIKNYFLEIINDPNHDERILFDFVEQIKLDIGFRQTQSANVGSSSMPAQAQSYHPSWSDLTQKPWTMNWEPIKIDDKYDGIKHILSLISSSISVSLILKLG